MAITFAQTKKRQRYLLIILGLVLIATLAVFLTGRRRPASVSPSGQAMMFRPPEIKINFDVLKEFPELKAFEGIVPLEGKIGRDNPFIKY